MSNIMAKFVDMYGIADRLRIRAIADQVAQGKRVAFVVEDDGKADRYLAELRKIHPTMLVLERLPGPAKGCESVIVSLSEN